MRHINTTWQVNPMNDVKSCFATAGTPDIRPYMPDLTGFTVTGDAVQINDQECDNWKLAVTTLNKTSNYDFYVSRTTGLPVRYQMMGYDSLIGSHFDLYILDYTTFVSGVSWNSTVFEQPPLQCGGFPAPGAAHAHTDFPRTTGSCGMAACHSRRTILLTSCKMATASSLK